MNHDLFCEGWGEDYDLCVCGWVCVYVCVCVCVFWHLNLIRVIIYIYIINSYTLKSCGLLEMWKFASGPQPPG